MEPIMIWGAGTTRTQRAYWALHELGMPYRAHTFGPRTGVSRTEWFTAINPKQKIPVLADGNLHLTESGAIIGYLDARAGGHRLVPDCADHVQRARYDEWLCFILMELDAHTLYVMRKHGDLAPLYGEAPNAMTAAREGFFKQVAVVEQHLNAGNTWLLGERFSGVDILLTTCIDWALAYGLDVAHTLRDYSARANARSACQAARQINYQFDEGATIEVTP